MSRYVHLLANTKVYYIRGVKLFFTKTSIMCERRYYAKLKFKLLIYKECLGAKHFCCPWRQLDLFCHVLSRAD